MQDFGKPLLYAILVHLGLLVLMIVGTWDWKKFQEPRLAGLNIEAVVVDSRDLNKKIKQAENQLKARARKNQAIERRQQELEAQKIRQQQQREDENKRQQLLAEQRRQAAAAKKLQQDKDRKKQAELEKQRKAQDELVKQRQAELEKIRIQREAQEQKVKEESEKLRKLAEDRKAREKAAADKRMRDQLNAEARAAEQAAILGTLHDQYVLEIKNLITRNWYRPPTAEPGLRCVLLVQQIPGGEVINAAVVKNKCNADEITQRSIEAAVRRAGYLPYQGFEKVFEREIQFEFEYNGD